MQKQQHSTSQDHGVALDATISPNPCKGGADQAAEHVAKVGNRRGQALHEAEIHVRSQCGKVSVNGTSNYIRFLGIVRGDSLKKIESTIGTSGVQPPVGIRVMTTLTFYDSTQQMGDSFHGNKESRKAETFLDTF